MLNTFEFELNATQKKAIKSTDKRRMSKEIQDDQKKKGKRKRRTS